MLYNSKVYYYNVIFHNTNTAYISDMVIYLKPIAAKFEENPSIGIGCIERTVDGQTDRPTVGRTRQSESIIAPPHDKSV